MLQYLTQPADKYSIAEQCQMVIEGGCAWIQLHLPDADDTEIRELAAELIPLCKETSTILMLENRPELAKELGLHGVHLTLDSGFNAAKIREDFGPEAIIGIEVAEPSAILALKGADIDYVSLPSSLGDEKRKHIVDEANSAGNEMPVVFEGNYGPEDAGYVTSLGASGICTGSRIAQAHDPVEYTGRLIDALRNAR